MFSLNGTQTCHVAEPKVPYGPFSEGGAYSQEAAGEPSTYDALVESIVTLHRQSAGRAAAAVNRWLTLRNWLIGAHLIEFEQRGENRAAYGERVLDAIASDVRSHGVQGLGVTALKACRQVYRMYPQVNQAVGRDLGDLDVTRRIRQSVTGESKAGTAQLTTRYEGPSPLSVDLLLQLSWTHLVELVQVDDPWKRAFYENECLRGNWSVRQLQRQIGSLLYERTALSTDKRAVIEAARQQAVEATVNATDVMRDPYVLEFVGLGTKTSYRETDLEGALLDHLQSFLLELGTGFCFEARQKRITVGDEHDFIDLVFYQRELRCHVLLDLKIRPFRPADAGQMNFYLNYWKRNAMGPGDNPPVGLILCSGKNVTNVEYATTGIDQRLFVSRYLSALPSPEQLSRLIETDRAAIEVLRKMRN